MADWKDEILNSFKTFMDKENRYQERLVLIDQYMNELINEFNYKNDIIKAELEKNEIGWDVRIHDKRIRITEKAVAQYEKKYRELSLKEVLAKILVGRFKWEDSEDDQS